MYIYIHIYIHIHIHTYIYICLHGPFAICCVTFDDFETRPGQIQARVTWWDSSLGVFRVIGFGVYRVYRVWGI